MICSSSFEGRGGRGTATGRYAGLGGFSRLGIWGRGGGAGSRAGSIARGVMPVSTSTARERTSLKHPVAVRRRREPLEPIHQVPQALDAFLSH